MEVNQVPAEEKKVLSVSVWISSLYRLVDPGESEVRYAALTTLLLTLAAIHLNVHAHFPMYLDELCALLQVLIGALVSLIGVAISGIAIVIVFFSREQIARIEKYHKNAFEILLKDFQWLAVVSALDTACFVGLILLLRAPYPLVSCFWFYAIVAVVTYSFFYLLFYGCALIGNCIEMAKIKNMLEASSGSVPEHFYEIQIDFLTAFYLTHSGHDLIQYYEAMIRYVEDSSLSNKEEIVQFLQQCDLRAMKNGKK